MLPPLVGQDDPDLLDRLDDVPMAAPALRKHHGVARAAAPRRAVGIGQEEETWTHRAAAWMPRVAALRVQGCSPGCIGLQPVPCGARPPGRGSTRLSAG